MPVSFTNINIHQKYDRAELANLWGYDGTQGLKRGVITPASTNFIILFVTKEKAKGATQYNDYINGNILHWDGEEKHGSDSRILKTQHNDTDEIHLFYRDKARDKFTYYGLIKLIDAQLSDKQPSEFKFTITSEPVPEEQNLFEDLQSINTNPTLTTTERDSLIKSRVGQGIFRDRVIEYWGGCAVTGLNNSSLLIASHIKPWADSSNQERLNPMNGLLLNPTLDKLFDRGFISFNQYGHIEISSQLSEQEIKLLGIFKDMKLRKLNSELIANLKYHSDHVFKRV
jgi:putative restriction endonuclease